ncbi:hypothetical protein [Pseudonocardia halophobica]|uniref:hypothetical protein n=1 Tax=Pseudonocardia halophobica TaxID=29401 RepID=UPI000564A772|nr:hypothetical protein [Pseudonocardia halophobica]
MTYTLAGEEVFFRTGSRTKAAAASKGAVFAFQVDDIDFDDQYTLGIVLSRLNGRRVRRGPD